MQNPEEDDGELVLEHLKKRLCYPKLSSFPSTYLAKLLLSSYLALKRLSVPLLFRPTFHHSPLSCPERRKNEGRKGRREGVNIRVPSIATVTVDWQSMLLHQIPHHLHLALRREHKRLTMQWKSSEAEKNNSFTRFFLKNPCTCDKILCYIHSILYLGNSFQ